MRFVLSLLVVGFGTSGLFANAATDPNIAKIDAMMKAGYLDCDPKNPIPEQGRTGFSTVKYNVEGLEHILTIYKSLCFLGAYNMGDVYFSMDSSDGILRPVSFSVPALDIKYKKGVDGFDDLSTVESLKVVGFTSTMVLVNSELDLSTLELSSYSKWRGIGDAFDNGTWKLDPTTASFVLKSFVVDASYDENIDESNDVLKGMF